VGAGGEDEPATLTADKKVRRKEGERLRRRKVKEEEKARRREGENIGSVESKGFSEIGT